MQRSRCLLWQLLVLPAMTCVVSANEPESTGSTRDPQMAFSLSSPAFEEGGMIPARLTCDGENRSPQLAWTEPPAGTKSLALIVDDPDAPSKTWVHWVVYNLPATTRSLPEAFPSHATLPDGTRQGITDFGTPGYGGPCPPSGTHRYAFKLFALDTRLSVSPRADAAALEAAMRGHALGMAQLTGTYRRQ